MTCGIYRIFNIGDSKSYVGSSNDVTRRLSFHFRRLKRGTHHNIHLQRAWDKYGETKFVSELLEECARDDLLKREKFWMDFYIESLYNICTNPEVTNSGIKRSLNFKQRVRQSLLGRKRPKDVCEKISAGQRKRWESKKSTPYTFYDDKSKYKRKKPKSFISPNGELFGNICNLTKFSKKYNLVMQRMSDVFLGKLDNHKGFIKV